MLYSRPQISNQSFPHIPAWSFDSRVCFFGFCVSVCTFDTFPVGVCACRWRTSPKAAPHAEWGLPLLSSEIHKHAHTNTQDNSLMPSLPVFGPDRKRLISSKQTPYNDMCLCVCVSLCIFVYRSHWELRWEDQINVQEQKDLYWSQEVSYTIIPILNSFGQSDL